MTDSSKKKSKPGNAGVGPNPASAGTRLLLGCLVLGLAVLALYGRALTFGMTDLDDDNLVKIFTGGNFDLVEAFQSDAFMHHKGSNFYRPLQSATFMLDAARAGGGPAAYHQTNVALHWAAVCALFGLLIALGVNRRLSLGAALLFAVHPLFVQAVAWIPGRGDLLLGLFGLLAFTALVRFRASGNPLLAVAHAAAFFCALLSKESAVMLPFLFATYLFAERKKPYPKHRQTPAARVPTALILGAWLLAGWILAGGGYLLLRHSGMSNLPGAAMFGLSPLAANLRTIPEMLCYLAVPIDVPVMAGHSVAATAIGLAVIAAIAVAAARQRKLRSPLLLLGALWYAALSAPGMMYRHEFGSHAYDFLNHRSYLPMAGIFIALTALVPARWLSVAPLKRRFFPIIAIAAVVLGALAWRQCGFFADPLAFYNQAARTNPNSALALNNRATLKAEQGDFTGVRRDCDAAIRLFPEYAEAYLNRGNARAMLGDAAGAVADYSRVIELKPGNVNAFDNRARARYQLGDTAGVMADLTQAIALDPSGAERYVQRGQFEESIRDTVGAARDFRRAIDLDPRLAGMLQPQAGTPIR